jgi:hypothetical protein
MQSFGWESGEVLEFYFVSRHFILFCYLWGAFMLLATKSVTKTHIFNLLPFSCCSLGRELKVIVTTKMP